MANDTFGSAFLCDPVSLSPRSIRCCGRALSVLDSPAGFSVSRAVIGAFRGSFREFCLLFDFELVEGSVESTIREF